MNAQLVLLSVDLATIVMLALLGLRVVSVYPTRRESWLIAFLCVASIAHVALSRADYTYWIAEPYRFDFGVGAPAMDVVRNMTPGLFAVLTSMLFTDRRVQPSWLYGLLALQFILEIFRARSAPGADELSAWLQVTFAGFAIYWTIGYWRVDLVEARRRTRAVVAIILGVNVVASTILLRLILAENSVANYQGHVVLSVATLALLVFLLLRLMSGEVAVLQVDPLPIPTDVAIEDRGQEAGESRPSKPRPAAAEVRHSEDELALTRLDSLLREQHIYRDPSLSLQQLAKRVGLPEYRLRQLIHKRLGFRNFNSFLHAHRIRDAVEQLTDPERRDTLIVTIAQSVGYESVNTFNRGFKEVMDLTPSEFRERTSKGMAGASSPNC